MTERRYTDDEVAKIFHAAAESPATPATPEPGDEGMTLAELQAIGQEAGMSAEAVARAARMLEVRDGRPPRTLLGLRTRVERRVELPRTMSDEEWERLVVQLREVFAARGRLTGSGSLRQWTNGNLYALVEPTATGSRLRLGSRHGGATASIRMGFAIVAAAVALSAAQLFGMPPDPGSTAGVLAVGLTLLTTGALRVRPWARRREAQMEQIASQVSAQAVPAGAIDLPLPE